MSSMGPAAYMPQMTTAASSPASSVEPYDYIDPALEASSGLPVSTQAAPPMGIMADPQGLYSRPDLKRTYDRASPYSGPEPTYVPMMDSRGIPTSAPYMSPTTAQLLEPSAKRIKIDDLLREGANPAVEGVGMGMVVGSGDVKQEMIAPPPLNGLPSPTSNGIDYSAPLDVRSLYEREYARALDAFFESKWFSTKGLDMLRADGPFYDEVQAFFTKAKARNYTYLEEEDSSITINETTELFWLAMQLIFGVQFDTTKKESRSASPSQQQTEDKAEQPREQQNGHKDATDPEMELTLSRVKMVQSLLSRTPVKLPTPASSPAASPRHNSSELKFWDSLRTFVGIPMTQMQDLVQADNLLRQGMHPSASSSDSSTSPRLVLVSIAEEGWLTKRLVLDPNATEQITQRLGQLRMYIEGIARSSPQDRDGVIRRICGRAVELWTGSRVETHMGF